jgi:hypothetical protein
MKTISTKRAHIAQAKAKAHRQWLLDERFSEHPLTLEDLLDELKQHFVFWRLHWGEQREDYYLWRK